LVVVDPHFSGWIDFQGSQRKESQGGRRMHTLRPFSAVFYFFSYQHHLVYLRRIVHIRWDHQAAV
jgi:hypothetical protein